MYQFISTLFDIKFVIYKLYELLSLRLFFIEKNIEIQEKWSVGFNACSESEFAMVLEFSAFLTNRKYSPGEQK